MEKIIKLKVVDVVQETPDAISIHFKQPFFKKIKYTPGQFLTLLVNVDGKVERRCYSLNSAPKVDQTVSVTVKRIKDGKVSNFLFDNIKKGEKIKVLYPMGDFTIKPDAKLKRHIVLFGAGSGITPLISILKSILHLEPQSIVSLFYGNRDVESIIFNKDLMNYQNQFVDRLQLVHIIEQPGDFKECYKGRVERSQVAEYLKKIPKWAAEETEYFICGPSGMMIEAEEGLKAAGVDEKTIHIERFSAPPPSAQEMQKVGAFLENREMKIIRGGTEHTITVQAKSNILEAALDHKLSMPYVCMDGICGSCTAKVKQGEVYMRDGHVLSKEQQDEGYILPCICHPVSNDVVIEYA
ncbi:ferredoxin--NADP reductase [Flammeovirga yaeyamensis]|uniref:Ferredoxin--NADP reductase n=1 Tax=Flammeovirga yaeyamensis TaxID=367791 RepID=A0AAX1N730_9BACT|nr:MULTISPECIES: ferredoxin--NADP reductase [Flammeovirga]ANQ49179.1 ferredoxin--NADP reductase [Flammeovirga sp. MY04]MBB3697958.1 ring-1,2-phenylacetyl-CoA epoxidase subunit PaaE [Flammeovirga yaeyamensis]NMF35689.1 ferredoxin--NADP reductase [Flammeovirga yaeyamensis]QWG03358.1 ferredoxin--NADP reductase [Flammeovirga yaeyamensis]